MERVAKITQYFTDLPANEIDQGQASYGKRPCCVGAHLAHLLQVGETERTAAYLSGADALARRLGGTRAHLILMLRECGASYDPFDNAPWHLPAAEVFQRLATIETLPSLVGADLHATNLRGAILEGVNLTGANLAEAKCLWADLRRANLTEANLREADLAFADLSGANLTRATCSWEDLTKANLKGANLTGAEIE